MNPREEWQKGLSGFFLNLAVVCFTAAILEPILRGANFSDANPKVIYFGLGLGVIMMALARAVLFVGRWRRPWA